MTVDTTGRWGLLAEGTLTVAAAGIATGVAINGMWRVFTDQLAFTRNGAIILCAFLEIAMLVSAIRARRSLRQHGTVGVDGAAVWALALISAVLSAADAQGLGRGVRFAAPLVAAWLWERGLAAERRAAHTRTKIAWRVTRERVAVTMGLADPAERSTTDVARSRRLARLTRARLKVAVLEAASGGAVAGILAARPVRLSVSRWRLQRQTLAAVEHLQLGTDPKVAAAIRSTVAAVVGLESATDPAYLGTAMPWVAPVQPRQTKAPAIESPQVKDPPAAIAATANRKGPRSVPEINSEVADMTVNDQVAWFARQMPRHPGRTVADWVAETGLAQRTVERRMSTAKTSATGAIEVAQ